MRSNQASEQPAAHSCKSNFIILFEGRAGSSYLVEALDNHPEIRCRSELLVKQRNVPRNEERAKNPKRIVNRILSLYPRESARHQIELVRRFYNRNNPAWLAQGFKTKVSDILDMMAMRQVLESISVKAIVLCRRNLIKQAVSHLTARRLYEKTKNRNPKTGWNLYDEKDRLGPVSVDVNELDTVLKEVLFRDRVMQAFADLLAVPKLYLDYAELLKNKDDYFAKIFKFVGVRPFQLQSSVLKNTDNDLRRALNNFEELKSHYRGTEFEAMLDER
jgi:hypothetical protein